MNPGQIIALYGLILLMNTATNKTGAGMPDSADHLMQERSLIDSCSAQPLPKLLIKDQKRLEKGKWAQTGISAQVPGVREVKKLESSGSLRVVEGSSTKQDLALSEEKVHYCIGVWHRGNKVKRKKRENTNFLPGT